MKGLGVFLVCLQASSNSQGDGEGGYAPGSSFNTLDFFAMSRQVICHYPNSDFAEDIVRIAARIVRLWDAPPQNSSALLMGNTQQIFAQRHPPDANAPL